MSDNNFMTVAEVQKILGVSRNATYTLVSRSDFPALRVGKRILIPAKQFEAWVDRQVNGAQIAG